MGILSDIEKHKKTKTYPKVIAGIIISGVIGYFSYANFFADKKVVSEIIIKTAFVTTGDLKTSISGDGKVLYKEDYNLNFPISGTVKTLEKEEGAIVKANDIIATLDSTYLELTVDKAEIALRKAEADLNAKRNQFSSSDIQLSRDQLNSVKANLNNIKLAGEIDITNAESAIKTAEISLASAQNDLNIAKSNLNLIQIQEEEKYNNKLEDILSVIGTNISFSKEIILKVDLLLGVTNENEDKNDAFEDYLGAEDKIIKNLAIANFTETNNNFILFLDEWKIYRSGEDNLSKAYYFLDKAEKNTKRLNTVLANTLETVKNSIASANSLSEAQINAYINEYENSILDTKKEIHNLIEAGQNTEEQLTTLKTKTATQENVISSQESKYQLAVQKLEETKINLENANQKSINNFGLAEQQIVISETSLLTKTEGPSYSELAPFYTNIENAKKSLEEARKKLEDAVLRSPIDGKIVKIDGNIGSFVGGDKDVSFVTITNNTKFYVESYVEELDITRIIEDAKVYLSFDAIDGINLEGNVYYISDKSTTDNNGIVTYKVEIQFDPKSSGVREGMTTYVEYITNEVKNVKIIPVGAVKPVDGKPSVQLEDSTWKPVMTGFTDGKMVEIMSGLEKGEKIIY
ncbi:MAG: HlyD family efflux transporter periplasmic adaptor subunit [Candidatus Gracilibacteria bacterium]